jgi:polygalacturonase
LSGLPSGATVTVTVSLPITLLGVSLTSKGDVKFTGGAAWDGPMFIIGGTNVAFNGGGTSSLDRSLHTDAPGHTFDGQGATYWDGLGNNDGASQKPVCHILVL